MMERTCIKLLMLLFTIFFQCSSTTQKESVGDADTTEISLSPQKQEEPSSTEVADEPDYTSSFDMDEFTKHPFDNDYPYIKTLLKENRITFTIIEEDTIHSEQRTIEFDSSRIEFLDSDPQYQDELGDLICSADIRSPKFQFNQGITIGITQEEFLTNANLTESSLIQDEATGHSYYENKVSWDEEGYWKVTFWFHTGLLVRIQSEISPCYYDYGD
jgi:hypothetical protein